MLVMSMWTIWTSPGARPAFWMAVTSPMWALLPRRKAIFFPLRSRSAAIPLSGRTTSPSSYAEMIWM